MDGEVYSPFMTWPSYMLKVSGLGLRILQAGSVYARWTAQFFPYRGHSAFVLWVVYPLAVQITVFSCYLEAIIREILHIASLGASKDGLA